jgi:biotin carboxyl carrier protein
MEQHKMINAVAQKKLEVTLKLSGAKLLQDGSKQAIDICKISPTRYHLLLEGRSVEAHLADTDREGKHTVWNIAGASVEVEILDETDMAIQKLGMANTAHPPDTTVRAPMPGQILEVYVEPGQTVAAGDSLLVLKAMKMENIIRSPRDGVVRQVSVIPGALVEKHAVLMHF